VAGNSPPAVAARAETRLYAFRFAWHSWIVMQDSPAVSTSAWDAGSAAVPSSRQRTGQALISAATVGLLAIVAIQTLHTVNVLDAGFANWRPVLYAYVAWALALCAGLVLSRGEHGRRAIFVLPAVLFTVSMVIFPTVFGLYIAFTDWNLSSRSGRHFSGLDNFRQLIHDSYYRNSLINMIYYVLSVFVQYAIAFGLALLLNADVRGRKFFRVTFLLPFMLSPVAVSWMIGKSMMDLRFGPVSDLARRLGWDTPAFFGSAWPARLSIMGMDAWVSIPFMMVLLLAGLQALPGEVLESAKVDGATGWKSFWQMTFPLLLPVSITAVVLRIIFELKLADIVITMTGGGPGGATDTVTSFIYREYRDRSNVGYGTALAQVYLFLIIIFILTLLSVVTRWMRRFS
jgi:multiple sugar transport system permease protein